MNLFFKVFAESLSNLVNYFWENCFRKPKLLLAANRLIYLNILIGISKFHGLLARQSFFYRNNYLWGNYLMIFILWSRKRGKLILRNYFPSTVFTKRFVVNVWHRRCVNKPWALNMPQFLIYQGSEYTRVLNMFLVFWICQGSGYTTALNMPGVHRVLNTLDYSWMCLNLSAWLLFYIYPL